MKHGESTTGSTDTFALLQPKQNPQDMCPPGGKMPGAGPQSHDAGGWGSTEMGTVSRRHHEWTPHLLQFWSLPPPP